MTHNIISKQTDEKFSHDVFGYFGGHRGIRHTDWRSHKFRCIVVTNRQLASVGGHVEQMWMPTTTPLACQRVVVTQSPGVIPLFVATAGGFSDSEQTANAWPDLHVGLAAINDIALTASDGFGDRYTAGLVTSLIGSSTKTSPDDAVALSAQRRSMASSETAHPSSRPRSRPNASTGHHHCDR